jgi:hypothetical protein
MNLNSSLKENNLEALHFVYWLQGHAELNSNSGNDEGLNAYQWAIVKDHIALVLNKQTPFRTSPPYNGGFTTLPKVDNGPTFTMPLLSTNPSLAITC